MKKSSTSFRFSSFLFFFIVAASSNVAYSEDEVSIVVSSGLCAYWLVVQTGTIADAGTDSRISVTFGNSVGERVEIPDLKKWGKMRPGHDYFENGNIDRFGVISSCFPTDNEPLCNITVTSDGTGPKPEWFLGAVSAAHDEAFGILNWVRFDFNKWLANDELTASVNKCNE